MSDDLRARARQVARGHLSPFPGMSRSAADAYENGFVEGALWHAAQQPTREQIARALLLHPVTDGAADTLPEIGRLCESAADAVLALLDGAGS